MAALPKRKRSKQNQRTTRSQPSHKAKHPLLVKAENGKVVPAHMVTKDNPVYKGVKFLRLSKKTK